MVINLFGAEIRLKQEIFLDLPSTGLKDVLRALKERVGTPLEKFLEEDLSPAEGCAVLLNGRNVGSLGPGEGKVREGDEITFTVLVAGG